MSDDKLSKEISLNFIEGIHLLWKNRIVILLIFVLWIISLVFYSFSLKDKFKSESMFTLVGGSKSSSISSALSQYSGLAQLGGINISADSISDLASIENILGSRTFRERVANFDNILSSLIVDDQNELKRERIRIAEELLGKILIVSVDGKKNSVTLSAETNDPLLSYKIVLASIETVESLLNERNNDSAYKAIELVEGQVRQQSKKMELAQKEMANFQAKYKVLNPILQSENYIQVVSSLRAQRIQLEIQLRQFEDTYNQNDSRIQVLKNQINSINTQLNEIEKTGGGVGEGLVDTAELLIEYQNIYRNLEISQKLYSALLASLEQSRISLNENQVFIRVLDPPLIPDVKSGPSRAIILVVGAIVGFLTIILGVFMWDGIITLRTKYKGGSFHAVN